MKIHSSTLLLVVLCIFIVGALLLVQIEPPSSSSDSRAAQNLDLNPTLGEGRVFLEDSGSAPRVSLRYTRPGEATKNAEGKFEGGDQYRITVHHERRVEVNGNFQEVKSSISSDVVLAARPTEASGEYLYFESFEVEVSDNGEFVELTSMETMLSGITLQTALHPEHGLGRVATFVKINPQIGRILFYLSDVVRDVYTAFPSEPIGKGAKWHYTRMDDATSIPRLNHLELLSWDLEEGKAGVTQKTILKDMDGIERGQGQSELFWQNGKLLSATGSVTFEGNSVTYTVQKK